MEPFPVIPSIHVDPNPFTALEHVLLHGNVFARAAQDVRHSHATLVLLCDDLQKRLADFAIYVPKRMIPLIEG